MSSHRGRPALLAQVVVVGFLAIALFNPGAHAKGQPVRISEIKALCTSGVGLNRKLMAIDELCGMDTKEARAALEVIAKSSDDRTAVAAIAAIGREGYTGSETKLLAIAQTPTRSDTARSAALAAWAQAKKDAGKSWNDVKTTMENTTSHEAVRQTSLALKAKLWGGAK